MSNLSRGRVGGLGTHWPAVGDTAARRGFLILFSQWLYNLLSSGLEDDVFTGWARELQSCGSGGVSCRCSRGGCGFRRSSGYWNSTSSLLAVAS